MKIAVFGLSISSSWGNGHATLWRGLCRALSKQKHQVVFYERDAPYYAQHRDLHEIPGGELVLYENWTDIESRAIHDLRDSDAAILTSYCPDSREAESLMEEYAPLKVFYDLDAPVTIDRLRIGETVDYVGPRAYAPYDLVLSYTGGTALDALREELGARRVAPLYGSVDPEAHRPVPHRPEYGCDISYLGTWAADRQPLLERFFLEPARRLPHCRFLIGGAMYPSEFPWSENIYFVRHIAPPDHPAFYSSSRLTLNITRASMAAVGYCPSARLFEAAACGTPLLTDYWEGLEHFFEPGREILLARDSEEAVAAIRRDAPELQRIAQAARSRVLAEHTADHRARELVRLLASARKPQPAAAVVAES